MPERLQHIQRVGHKEVVVAIHSIEGAAEEVSGKQLQSQRVGQGAGNNDLDQASASKHRGQQQQALHDRASRKRPPA